MLFADKIRQLREEKQLLQRQLASALEIDTPMYSKIERGNRMAKRSQVIALARNRTAYLFWFSDKVMEVLDNEKELDGKALEMVNKTLKK